MTSNQTTYEGAGDFLGEQAAADLESASSRKSIGLSAFEYDGPIIPVEVYTQDGKLMFRFLPDTDKPA